MISCSPENISDSQVSKAEDVDNAKLLSDLNLFKSFWINRLSGVVTTNSEVDKNVKQMIKQIENLQKFELTADIILTAIRIAELADSESFMRVFSSFDKKLDLSVSKDNCFVCILDLKSGIYEKNFDSNALELRAPARDYTCRWTCVGGTSNGPPGSCTLTACQPGQNTFCCYETTIGCGFLWLGSCTGHDTVVDCP